MHEQFQISMSHTSVNLKLFEWIVATAIDFYFLSYRGSDCK